MAQKLQEADFGRTSGRGLSWFSNRRVAIGVLAIFFGGLFLLTVGVGFFLFSHRSGSDDIKIIPVEASASGQAGGQVVVDVEGEVVRPGLYKLASGVRVNDAIFAAGGLTEAADRAKLNLAAKLADGQRVWVPSNEGTTGIKGTTSITGLSNDLISINSASQAELEGLPGIGPATAAKIVAARPYSALEELVSRKVISRSVFEKIKEKISL